MHSRVGGEFLGTDGWNRGETRIATNSWAAWASPGLLGIAAAFEVVQIDVTPYRLHYPR